MVLPLDPAGHVRILAVQVGTGEIQLNVAPAGFDVNGIFVYVPEQIFFDKGVFAMAGI